MCNCQDLSDQEAQAFDRDLIERQKRIVADALGVSPDEVEEKALERIKHDIEVDAAKLERFERVVRDLDGLLAIGWGIPKARRRRLTALIAECDQLIAGKLP